MKTLFNTTGLAALFFVCFTCTVTAQDQIYSTIKDATFALTAIVQKPDGGIDKVRITNKDILTVLNSTGAFNFGEGAQLLLRSVEGAIPYFIVRESVSNQVTTADVSGYLTLTEPDDAVHGADQMINWGIWTYALTTDSGTDFTFWTLTTLHTGDIPTGTGGVLQRTVDLDSPGSGPGHVNGANAQFSGKVSGANGRIDDHPDQP